MVSGSFLLGLFLLILRFDLGIISTSYIFYITNILGFAILFYWSKSRKIKISNIVFTSGVLLSLLNIAILATDVFYENMFY